METGQWRSQGGSRGQVPVGSAQAPVVETRVGPTPSVFQYFFPTEILQRRNPPNDGVHCANIFVSNGTHVHMYSDNF